MGKSLLYCLRFCSSATLTLRKRHVQYMAVWLYHKDWLWRQSFFCAQWKVYHKGDQKIKVHSVAALQESYIFFNKKLTSLPLGHHFMSKSVHQAGCQFTNKGKAKHSSEQYYSGCHMTEHRASMRVQGDWERWGNADFPLSKQLENSAPKISMPQATYTQNRNGESVMCRTHIAE